jgi:hypothetical protein
MLIGSFLNCNMKSLSIILFIFVLGCDQQISLQDKVHLDFIALPMDHYMSATGKIPSDITDKDGKPLLSWRVAILKYGSEEGRNLYSQFKLDEPWNSPHNLKVAQTIPGQYYDPKGPKCERIPPNSQELIGLYKMNPTATNYTPYLAVTGPNAAFRPGNPRNYDKHDPHASIVVVEKSDILWTEPRDISLEKAKKGDCLRWYVIWSESWSENKYTCYLAIDSSKKYWEKDKPETEPNFEYEPDK